MTAELAVAHVDFTPLHLPCVAGLAAVNVEDPISIRRGDEADGIVGIVSGHGQRGHDENPVGVEGPRLVGLCSPDNDSVFPPFNHPKKEVGICLPVRGKAPVPLGICHGAVDGQIVFLHHEEKFLEPFMIRGAQFCVHFEGDAVHGIDGVHADAPLKARRRLLPHEALHLHFLDEVFRAPVKVAEPVDFVACQVRCGRHEFFVERVLGERVGHCDGIHGRTDDRMIDGIFHELSQKIDLKVEVS